MKQLIEDIKKLTNFFQFLQDFNPQDYMIETPYGYFTEEQLEVKGSKIL